MKIESISIPKEEAQKEWKEYNKILKERQEKYLKDMKNLYYHLKEGRKVLDIYKVFKDAGVSDAGFPKMAISLADKKTVYFLEDAKGSGRFSYDSWRGEWYKSDVLLPSNTFPEKRDEKGVPLDSYKLKTLHTTVPIVPARYLPKGKLENYYILWEVETWEEIIPPKDPILLRRINDNMFVVLAFWDLTPLERAIIHGRR